MDYFDAMQELGPIRPLTLEGLKKAYRRRSLATHPDAGGSGAKFMRTQRAYEFLRAKLEAESKASPPPPPPPPPRGDTTSEWTKAWKARQAAGIAKAVAARKKKATADLSRWERKLKMAQRKVKEYRRKVKRYENTA